MKTIILVTVWLLICAVAAAKGLWSDSPLVLATISSNEALGLRGGARCTTQAFGHACDQCANNTKCRSTGVFWKCAALFSGYCMECVLFNEVDCGGPRFTYDPGFCTDGEMLAGDCERKKNQFNTNGCSGTCP